MVDAFLRREVASNAELEVELREVRDAPDVVVLWSGERLLAALLPDRVAVNQSAPPPEDRRLVLAAAHSAGLQVELLGERQLWRRLPSATAGS